MRKFPLAILALCASLAAPAQAAEFNRLDAGRSSVRFVFKQMNVPVEGRFKRFTGEIAFDPARPEAGRAGIDIDLASIDAGSSEANEEVAGKLWFDTKTHPVARFAATAVRPLGGDRFEVAGRMSIKGRTHELRTPATFRIEGGAAVFAGSFVLKRADFGIGEGLWADFGTVANEVRIAFRLVATAAGP